MNRRRAYVIGFAASLVLTLIAYGLAARHVHSHHLIYNDNTLVGIVIALALAQFITQMIFFMHLGAEPKPRWNFVAFGLMGTVVVILVAGSLWIMYSLNYHMGSPDQTNQSIINDEGFGHQH